MSTIAPSCVWLKVGAEAQGPSTKQPVHFAVDPAYDQQSGPSLVTTTGVSSGIAAVATLNVPSGWSSMAQRDACLPTVAHIVKGKQSCSSVAMFDWNSVHRKGSQHLMRTIGHAYGCSDFWGWRRWRGRQVWHATCTDLITAAVARARAQVARSERIIELVDAFHKLCPTTIACQTLLKRRNASGRTR
jgi:hypothetical protein